MPVLSVTSDPEALTLVAVGEYPVSVQRLWAAWADPRQLERFWGPPTWPATFLRHELRVGGRCEYAMTGPAGETARGYWLVDAAEAERRLVVRDGFADPEGRPDEALPQTRMEIVFEAVAGGSRFVATSTFASLEAMEKLLAMGMKEGITLALAQMDEVLADLRDHAASIPAALELLDDTHARVVRDVRGSLKQVWRAHHEPALLQRWLLGPPGWTMPVCEVAAEVGGRYRYEWQSDDGAQRFGFEGRTLELEAPRRAVTTERMLGTDGPDTHNELLLAPLAGNRTRISVTITYPSRELRDMILGTGMVGGMEASYGRLEEVLAS